MWNLKKRKKKEKLNLKQREECWLPGVGGGSGRVGEKLFKGTNL